MQSSNDIILRKVGDETNELPRGVRLIVMNDKLVFVRRSGGRFMPVPKHEQDELTKKHVTK